MAKRPTFNPGSGVPTERPLPNVDVNPDSPAVVALTAGAAVTTNEGHQGLMPKMSSLLLPKMDKALFSLLETDIALLEQMASEYRRETGAGVTHSRIVRAALRLFAKIPDRNLQIAAVEELKPGRRKGGK